MVEIRGVSKHFGEGEARVDALRDVVHSLEVGDSVTLPKLGTFHAKMRNPRKVTTLSGNVVDVPARRAVTFRQPKSKAA